MPTSKKSPSINTIQLPAAGDLALVIEQELYKLPTEATHNHFHALAEKADNIQEQARTMSLVSLILCGLELEHIKLTRSAKGATQSQSVSPWKDWVSEHCEFSYKTATRYIKALKCAREGMLEGFDPESLPQLAPSLMSAGDLKDACTNLANSLQGYGSRRQLYLALDIIKTPQRDTMLENRTDNKGKKKADALSIEQKDSIENLTKALKPLDEYLRLGNHQHLPKNKLKELDDSLQSARELLKPLLN